MTAAAPLAAANAPPTLTRTDVAEEIFGTASRALAAGYGVALVTLVGLTGRSSRAMGAQMVVLDDGRHRGHVAGGCVEAAIAAEAAQSIASGHSRILKLGKGSPFFDIVLPCGGGLELALQIVRDPAVFDRALAAFAARTAFSLALDLAADTISFDPAIRGTGWGDDGLFHRAFRPRTRLVVCGRGIEAETLVRLACASDLDVVCVTPDPQTARMAAASRAGVREITRPDAFDCALVDADTAVALLFHDLDWELGLLRKLLSRPAFYIGALGSRTTHARRCEALAAAGVPPSGIARIKGPIGAFGPARDSATLAASILADVLVARVGADDRAV